MAAHIAHALRIAAGWLVEAMAILGPRAGLVLCAGLVAALLLLVFRRVADQRRLRLAKDRMQAALLGLALFRHDTGVMFGEEGRLIGGALDYLRAGLTPLAFVVIPMIVLIAELDLTYGRRALALGESAILTAQTGDADVLMAAQLTSGYGLRAETPALRIPQRGEVCWRIRAEAVGSHVLSIQIGDQSYSKVVAVARAGDCMRISPTRARTAWAVLLDSREPPLPADSGLRRVSVGYPRARVGVGPGSVHWLVLFLAATMIWGVALKGPLRVEL